MQADELQEPLLDGDAGAQTSWKMSKLIFTIADWDANRNSPPDVAYFEGKSQIWLDLISQNSCLLITAVKADLRFGRTV